jgi:hypothetical protein
MIIEDKLLEPYRIYIDERNFTVQRRGKSKKGEETFTNEGYFSKVENALWRISTLKRSSNKTVDLNGYAKEFARWEDFLREIVQSLNLKK